jgi:DNA-binding NtrC family response regulator
MVRGSDTAIRISYGLKKSAPKAAHTAALREIASALRNFGGDISKTAEKLGVGRVTLHRWIAEHSYLGQVLKSARIRGPE